ncbi:hypothetical protein CB0940_06458 [Cercospora beticola]|uniref:Uncharacterized protein n=1 Tax=Cercospora beticola TaxID=122368 RepID=A0A2G5I110_CERBT|nr:hypothetical protein CB0940_06458 [Cercospora beticola]PIA98487.1 hypothetical protein CB0940_06458 [Cercospora beticola]WPA99096.1 hypothetical protein RHO25_003711 [Cercospora beticola]CAK1360404.1 unnamed protein product [Cercospora beticola]
MKFTLTILALAASVLAQQELGGGIDGNAGPFSGTAGGAINGPTGFVQGCIGGGAGPDAGRTECFPVETAPAATSTRTQPGGKAAGTAGPASGFLDSEGLCAGAAYSTNGFTFCLQPTGSS